MTPSVQRPSSTGSITALDSTSNLSSVAGNSFWKAATVAVNGASGYTTSTATLSSGSSPPARLFARALKEVYVARHRACIGEQRAALIGQHRNTSAAIEELHTELPSRFARVWLTTDWARLRRRPAAEKLPSSTAAMKVAELVE